MAASAAAASPRERSQGSRDAHGKGREAHAVSSRKGQDDGRSLVHEGAPRSHPATGGGASEKGAGRPRPLWEGRGPRPPPPREHGRGGGRDWSWLPRQVCGGPRPRRRLRRPRRCILASEIAAASTAITVFEVAHLAKRLGSWQFSFGPWLLGVTAAAAEAAVAAAGTFPRWWRRSWIRPCPLIAATADNQRRSPGRQGCG